MQICITRLSGPFSKAWRCKICLQKHGASRIHVTQETLPGTVCLSATRGVCDQRFEVMEGIQQRREAANEESQKTKGEETETLC